MSGSDVKELLDLLLAQNINDFPRREVLSQKGEKPEFDEDFDKAVRFLQGYYSLPVNGVVDKEMIKTLRQFAE